MEIRVFDKDRNPVSIRLRDVENTKIINRRLCYLTIDGLIFYGPINLKEFAELHENQGMVQIDKNSVVNMNHIQYVIKSEVYIKGKKYIVARRRRTKFNDKWDEWTT